MDVVYTRIPFQYLNVFLLSERAEYFSRSFSYLAIQYLFSIFGSKDNMVLTIPLYVGL